MLTQSIKKYTGLFFVNNNYAFSLVPPGTSFYRRELPQQLIPFASSQGKAIFRQALEEGHCESFFTLVQHFITQNDISTCSTASMAMIFNALGIDPGSNWKGIWRWYDDYNIKHLNESKVKTGLTLKQYHDLALLNNVHSMAFSPLKGQSQNKLKGIRRIEMNVFKKCVEYCTRQSQILMTLNFHRKTLGQTGTGHFSPLAAYHPQKSLVLILDVAKFKYDPYWCDLRTVYESFQNVDSVSQQSRGFVLNSKKTNQEIPENVKLGIEKTRVSGKDVTAVASILNNQQKQAQIIGLLYEFATYELQQLDSSIFLVGSELGITKEMIGLLRAQLQPQTQLFLQAFERSGFDSLLTLLLMASTNLSYLGDRANFRQLLREISVLASGYAVEA